jgi:hypothetical protein
MQARASVQGSVSCASMMLAHTHMRCTHTCARSCRTRAGWCVCASRAAQMGCLVCRTAAALHTAGCPSGVSGQRQMTAGSSRACKERVCWLARVRRGAGRSVHACVPPDGGSCCAGSTGQRVSGPQACPGLHAHTHLVTMLSGTSQRCTPLGLILTCRRDTVSGVTAMSRSLKLGPRP